MASSKTHPHLDEPSEVDLLRIVESRSPAVREVYLEAHRLVLHAVPGVVCSVDSVDAQIGYGARQFGYDGWGMAAVAPFTRWVSLAILRGAELDDPDGLLEGAGASLRHVRIKSVEDLASRRRAIQRMLVEAAELNQR